MLPTKVSIVCIKQPATNHHHGVFMKQRFNLKVRCTLKNQYSFLFINSFYAVHDFALSFGAVMVKIIDLSKTESRDFFGIILDQKNSQKLHLLPKTC